MLKRKSLNDKILEPCTRCGTLPELLYWDEKEVHCRYKCPSCIRIGTHVKRNEYVAREAWNQSRQKEKNKIPVKEEYKCKIAKCCFSCSKRKITNNRCKLSHRTIMNFYVCDSWVPHEPRTYYIDGVDDNAWSERFERGNIR